jgi:tetratricopeptide (TPR) repeat protein
MRKVFFCMLIAALGAVNLPAQMDAKIETGVVAFNSQDYAAAMKALDLGLADPTLLKPKNVPRGYYFRGMTRFALLMQSGAAMKEKMDAGDTAAVEKMGIDMINNLKNAAVDYRKARETDAELKFTKDIENGIRSIRGIYTLVVNQSLDKLEEEEAKKTATPEDYQKAKELLVPLMDEMINLDPANAAGYDLRGQFKFAVKDNEGALTDYEIAIKKFTEKLPTEPDMYFAYTFYRAAMLHKEKNNGSKALELLGSGKNVADSEFKRLEAKKEYFHDTVWVKMIAGHDKIISILNSNELGILLLMPEKMDEAVAKFDKAIAESPKNYNLHVSYANLLEKVDSARAVAMYNKAMAIEPGRTAAYNNLGAYYNGKAKDYQELLKTTEDEKLITAYKTLRDANFVLAKPQFEKALELEPKNLEYVRALKQIAIFLNDEPGMVKYVELEKQIKAGN